jgi:hypothetical protein
MQVFTGNLMGEGSFVFCISRILNNANARYGMTMDTYYYHYLKDLYDSTYDKYSDAGFRVIHYVDIGFLLFLL